jgi:branched-chain amino acid transport system ATP-binding protein
MAVLEARELSKAYGGVRAVDGVSFKIAARELVALIGPNGAGKTTCFNLLSGQLRPDAGDVLLGGRSIAGLEPHRIWRMGVGRTFQITATFGSMSVRENVQMALLSAAGRVFVPWGRAARFAAADADTLLARVGMQEHAARTCATLAYGDLKRLELAIALAHRPRLLLMDEPTAGMAPEERGELMTLARELARDGNIAVLFTEHDMEVVFGHPPRILVLHAGCIIAEGSADEIRHHPHVQEVYLGAA